VDFGQNAAAQRMRRESQGLGLLLFGHAAALLTMAFIKIKPEQPKTAKSRGIGRPWAKIVPSPLATLDMEYKEAIHRLLALQRVTDLAQEMRDVDDGERIGAFDD
jgi:hypothetical protein